MTKQMLFGDLINKVIGGGWGEESYFEGSVPVSVIRGADFPAVRFGSFDSVPARWESRNKVEKRLLEPGDIILECAGGTSDRPTGRSIFIDEKLLKNSRSENLIPASFCKRLRVNSSLVEPAYLFWYLQHIYQLGKMWDYQVRSTGIANFQYSWLAESELVPLPARLEQQAIAATLGALDDKIESNQRKHSLLEQIAFAHYLSSSRRECHLFEVATLTMGSSPKGSTYNNHGDGTPFYQGVTDFGKRFPGQRTWTTDPIRFAEPNDSLFSVRAPVGRLNRAIEKCCVGRGVASIHSEFSSILFYALIDAQKKWDIYNAEGTVYGSINKNNLIALMLDWPEPTCLHELEASLSKIDLRILALHHESQNLALLRDTLLPELMSGRIRVAEARDAVQAATDTEFPEVGDV
ncbi:restriction endonuclease subunit S [Propionimicrobium sp. BV2F7]|uniref:restriction endonuclease subunit S n=1 Tax=Propionimicrobium TaxID=203133 RepID=UPI0003D796EF|nr:restriction endonuclease subunit S [Propionimicrobium sp. BV2F7]ETJ96766.1 type I restriction modification DNA specificity domain protein [Propionimicrobium sp. BV2F7]